MTNDLDAASRTTQPLVRANPVKPVSRRSFLATAAKASAVVAAPLVLPRRVWGANERVALGYVGCKNRGGQNMAAFAKTGQVDHVVACDVDTAVLDEFEQKLAKRKVSGIARVADHRELLDRDDIDAVVVSTPDHWHAIPTIDACRAGKDVYCEKPLTLFPTEGEAMLRAARESGRLVQTGSQQRSGLEWQKARDIVAAGDLGTITAVSVNLPRPNHPGEPSAASQPPSHLNFDRWLGPAPEVPYRENCVHYNFRFWWDYSGGQMTNFGAHHLDCARWAIGCDDVLPTHSGGTATFHPEGWHEVTETCRLTQFYPNTPVNPDGVTITIGQQVDGISGAVTFVGEKGTLHVNRGKLRVEPEGLLDDSFEKNDAHVRHVQAFVDCVRSRDTPPADIAIGNASANACHLANLVARLGREVELPDGQLVDGRVPGDDEANAILDRAYRDGYTLG